MQGSFVGKSGTSDQLERFLGGDEVWNRVPLDSDIFKIEGYASNEIIEALDQLSEIADQTISVINLSSGTSIRSIQKNTDIVDAVLRSGLYVCFDSDEKLISKTNIEVRMIVIAACMKIKYGRIYLDELKQLILSPTFIRGRLISEYLVK